MNDQQQWRSQVRAGVFGVLATAGALALGVTVVGASNGADDRPSTAAAASTDDDGTPDQGPGDADVSEVPSTAPPTTVLSNDDAMTSVPPSAEPAGPTRTIPVVDVGTVVITESPLGLVSATPVAGVSVDSEVSSTEVHVRFTDASGGRVDVQAEVEDGVVRVRVRDRRSVASPPTTAPSTTAVVVSPVGDDHGHDGGHDDAGDDSSGHGSDRSGPGGDDSSGSSGHGGDDSSGHGGDDR